MPTPPRSQSTDTKQSDHIPQSPPANHQAQIEEAVSVSVSILSVEEEFKKRQEEATERFKNLPEKYKGFESLMETRDDDMYYDRPPLPASKRNIHHNGRMY